MTAPARISQADIDRATKAAVASGRPARIVMDLEARRIEIIIGESLQSQPHAAADKSVWSDDDV